MKRQQLHEMLSGQAQGLPAQVARAGLRCLEPAYRAAIRYRNHRYDQPHRVHRISVPVISIGNLTTGGTGKTPMVRWTIEQLFSMTRLPAIVSRGYGSENGKPNDEYLELRTYLPDTPHVQNPDRIAAAHQVIHKNGASAIVLDDGFQHRRIGRDLDIVLIDLTCPFGFDHLLPRGLLREPLQSLRRCDAVVLTRRGQVEQADEDSVVQQIRPFIGEKPIATVSFPADQWVGLDEQNDSAGLNGQRVFGFCAIGNPEGFRRSLNKAGVEVVGFQPFADHHIFSTSDYKSIQKAAVDVAADRVVCTMKDFVKLRALGSGSAGPLPASALSIRVQFERGEDMLLELLRNTISTFDAKKLPAA